MCLCVHQCLLCSGVYCSAWEELLHAESGLPYYFNCITNETVWERPADFEKVMGDWIEKTAEDGKLFYVNRVRNSCKVSQVACPLLALSFCYP